MIYQTGALRPIDVVVNSAGPWSTVRVEQPTRLCSSTDGTFILFPHFDPLRHIRDRALVIWERPLPESVQQWRLILQGLRSRSCLVLVDWDDHPDLFVPSIRERFKAVDHIHLRCCHGIQTSNSRLAKVLRRFQPNVFVLENGVHPFPSLRTPEVEVQARVFLGNFNRVQEQRLLASSLREWLLEPHGPLLVTVGTSGLEATAV